MDTITLEGAGRFTGRVDVGNVIREDAETLTVERSADPDKMPIKFSKSDGQPVNLNGAAGWWQVPLAILDRRRYEQANRRLTYSEFEALGSDEEVPGSGGMTKSQVDTIPVSAEMRQRQEWFEKISKPAPMRAQTKVKQQDPEPDRFPAPEDEEEEEIDMEVIEQLQKQVRTLLKRVDALENRNGHAEPASALSVTRVPKTDDAPKAQAKPTPSGTKEFAVSGKVLGAIAQAEITSRRGRRPNGYAEFRNAVTEALAQAGATKTLRLDRVGAEYLIRAMSNGAGGKGPVASEFRNSVAAAFRLADTVTGSNGTATKPASAPVAQKAAPKAQATVKPSETAAKRPVGRPRADGKPSGSVPTAGQPKMKAKAAVRK